MKEYAVPLERNWHIPESPVRIDADDEDRLAEELGFAFEMMKRLGGGVTVVAHRVNQGENPMLPGTDLWENVGYTFFYNSFVKGADSRQQQPDETGPPEDIAADRLMREEDEQTVERLIAEEEKAAAEATQQPEPVLE